MGIEIVDTPTNITSEIDCFVSKGIKIVFRYYAPEGDHWKVITPSEATVILKAGIQIGIVFESKTGNVLTSFTKDTGYSDAVYAFKYASEIMKQPFGSGIYFAVDLDVSDSQITTYVIPYFTGVQKAVAEFAKNNINYKIGAYGCGKAVNDLKKNGLCEFRWLSESTSFNGTKSAFNNNEYELAQEYVTDLTICSVSVDKDVLANGITDIGTFNNLSVNC